MMEKAAADISEIGPAGRVYDTARGNRLLECLALNDLAGIVAVGEFASFGADVHVARGGDVVDEVYFPVSGYASLMASDTDNTGLQVAMVGTEGLLGWESLLGRTTFLLDIYVPEKLRVLRMNVEEIRTLALGNEPWRMAQLGSLTRLFAVATRSALCARFHLLEARLARCLLEIHDHHPEVPIRLTQHTLANLLGVRRSGISTAATHLQVLGLIQYRRGAIRILNRQELEAAACDCYRQP
ncbi:Crp/Fnr family transcriptional regulator [Wenzhouxiangella sp. EGI_FJ10305]|uniref:Crp/Fnr family transcriptional regulator n=1 Tax=Wenzhouxiangella sp. EGI_FJ10305 TaxID=3243768 RepID=UPI0035DFDE83